MEPNRLRIDVIPMGTNERQHPRKMGLSPNMGRHIQKKAQDPRPAPNVVTEKKIDGLQAGSNRPSSGIGE